MNQEDIIRIARKAGIKNDCDGIWCNADQLVGFAKLVAEFAAKAEREACARLCMETEPFYGAMFAEAIRARGR